MPQLCTRRTRCDVKGGIRIAPPQRATPPCPTCPPARPLRLPFAWSPGPPHNPRPRSTRSDYVHHLAIPARWSRPSRRCGERFPAGAGGEGGGQHTIPPIGTGRGSRQASGRVVVATTLRAWAETDEAGFWCVPLRWTWLTWLSRLRPEDVSARCRNASQGVPIARALRTRRRPRVPAGDRSYRAEGSVLHLGPPLFSAYSWICGTRHAPGGVDPGPITSPTGSDTAAVERRRAFIK